MTNGEDFGWGGLMNWPPSRGPIDPYLPRKTYMPNVSRDYKFKKPSPVSSTIVELKRFAGPWYCNYRVQLIRSLNYQQAMDLILMKHLEDEEAYGRWNISRFGEYDEETDDYEELSQPSFYVDIKSLPTWKGEYTLPKPYRFIIKPCRIKSVLKGLKGEVREAQEYEATDGGYFLFSLAKELEKLYKKHKLDGFADLYFQKVYLQPDGYTKVEYKLHKSPKKIKILPPAIKQEDIEIDDREKTKLSRANARKIRACGLEGAWNVWYQVSMIGTLTLLQAHELLFANKAESEIVDRNHFEFTTFEGKAYFRQKKNAEAMLSREPFLKDEDEDDWKQAHEEEYGEERYIEWEQQFFCPHCYLELEFEYKDSDLEDDDERPLRHVYCPGCKGQWYEPAEQIYRWSYESSYFDYWDRCRGNDAPSLIVELDYPLRKIVRLTIPPAVFQTDIGEYQIMSPGYLLWVVANEYRRIYANHEHYEIWGHGINDLNFEMIDVSDDGNAGLFIGS
jgi:hypothetical protein